ncbi:MAG: hypothetical protein GY796_09060 [Chloroflexi bacterium]|nr:hypothetical protein [Chloroflexota bacterium]
MIKRDRKSRISWDAQAVWYRVRYTEPTAVRKCLLWLATANKIGRIALWHEATPEMTTLHIGLPAGGAAVFTRMAGDYGFSLQPKLSQTALPPAMKLYPLNEDDLPWEVSFMAHIVAGWPFASRLNDENKKGQYLPTAPEKKQRETPSTWALPSPDRGMRQRPVWPHVNGAGPELAAAKPDAAKWLLGRGVEGTPLQAGGRLNLYGGAQETADWLAQMTHQMIRLHPGNLILIDGRGNLAPQLKRKQSILRLIGDKVTYMDMDNALTASGFNPLAAVPGETEAQTIRRWQDWFSHMGVHRSNLPPLAEAFNQGAREIGALRRWLDEPGQQIRQDVTASLARRLETFLETRTIREWVDWPDNPFRLLPEGVLLFACECSSWERQQLLNAVLLGAFNSAGARLILHGIPWRELRLNYWLLNSKTIITSNGPLFPDGRVVLVRCEKAEAAALLANRFFPEDPQLRENVHLLQRGEGILINKSTPIYTAWND